MRKAKRNLEELQGNLAIVQSNENKGEAKAAPNREAAVSKCADKAF